MREMLTWSARIATIRARRRSMSAGDGNQQAVAAEHTRHRERGREPNRASNQIAGPGRERDIQTAAAKIRDKLVGGAATDGMTDLIVERGASGDRERIEAPRQRGAQPGAGIRSASAFISRMRARRLEGIEPKLRSRS